MRRTLVASLAIALAGAAAAADGGRDPSWTSAARWSAQLSPKPGPARAIGFYTAGCVEGAEALPPAGAGFEVLRFTRRRYFGHPVLIEFVRRLGEASAKEGLPALLVGDVSQPRGGPTPTDHGSHQSGLDVDIAYVRPREAMKRQLREDEREGFRFIPVVDVERKSLLEEWHPRIGELLELAASDPAVDRIFVNPVVKRELCAHATERAGWLGRIRPWWGHHDHFHVRLQCPAGSTDCRRQAPVPAGDGCGDELSWWFSRDALREAQQRRSPAPGALPRTKLPARCRDLLQ
ncbi:MAG: penicillin-insensitive murein endopeptidase [Candidatus Binatia bacterium]